MPEGFESITGGEQRLGDQDTRRRRGGATEGLGASRESGRGRGPGSRGPRPGASAGAAPAAAVPAAPAARPARRPRRWRRRWPGRRQAVVAHAAAQAARSRGSRGRSPAAVAARAGSVETPRAGAEAAGRSADSRLIEPNAERAEHRRPGADEAAGRRAEAERGG